MDLRPAVYTLQSGSNKFFLARDSFPMAQPFDITLKHLLESHPADCLRLVGLPTVSPIEVIDADLATVIAEADKVFRVKDQLPWLMHFELQASYDRDLPQRM